jgi:hypothetical protein
MASWLPTLNLERREPLESDPTLLNLDRPAELFDFLLLPFSLFKKASMAFLRTAVMFSLDLNSAGVPLVMKMRPPSFCGASLVAADGLFDIRGGRAEGR